MNVTGFLRFTPHLPFRYVATIYDGLMDENKTSNHQFAVSSITINNPDCDASAGATFYGDGFFTIPVFNLASRTMDITFEETDDLQISRLFAAAVDSNFHSSPYLLAIGITEFARDMSSVIRRRIYYGFIKSYTEPSFSRTGNPGVVTIDCTFQIMSERNWDGKGISDVGVMKNETPVEDLSVINNYGTKVDPKTKTSVVPAEWKAAFDKSKAQHNSNPGGNTGSGGGSGGTPSGPVGGKQIAATGGVGAGGVNRNNLKALATAEFTGTNGAGRKEGDADLVYLNNLDGGVQKGNFGMGNTQKYLEGQGLKNAQLTIIDTRTGQKYTGTMEQLTKVMQEKGGANGAKSVWRMDKASTAKVEEASMGHIADTMIKNVDKDILAAMDKTTIGGLAHIEYGAGGSMSVMGKYMAKHKEEILADLKKNNGQMSEEMVNKMMEDNSVKKVLYKEWTVTQGKHAGERYAVDRRGRLTGRAGHTMKKLN